MGKIIGIDLGTTNSCVAYSDGGEVKVIPNEFGDRTTPSTVAIKDGGAILVGAAAKRQAVANPRNSLFGIKRLIGRTFDSPVVTQLRKTMPYDIVKAPNGDAWVRLGEQEVSPSEVSAHVLRYLKGISEKHLNEKVTDAVITVPAYFDDAQRQATKDAGKIAGLTVRSVLNEPTAAAVAYGIQKVTTPQTIAVFDLGGGTFDISIVRIEQGVFEVLSTNGDTFLGGDDLDRCLIEALVQEFKAEQKLDLNQDAAALQRLKGAVEVTKHELSTTTTAQLRLPFVGVGASGPLHLQREVTREWFESLTQGFLGKLAAPCRQALEDAHLTSEQIDQVVLVGGMTRMPAVQKQVEAIFGKQPSKGVNPDEIVALGAATMGALIEGELQEVVLLDVTSHSLGIRVQGDRFSPVISRNVTIPVRERKIFATTEDDQSVVVLEVFQGEAPMASQNRSLGQFVLGDLPRAPAGAIQVQVSFMLDVDGILSVAAKETRSGKATSIKVNASSGLSRSEVDRLVAVNQGRETRT